MEIKCAYQLLDNKINELDLTSSPCGRESIPLINVYDVGKHKFGSFGGALTHSSAYLFSRLNKENQEKALEMLVGKSGLRYSRFRLCIGSSDFATHSYTYVKEGDMSLESFSIEEDKKFLIPFIKEVIGHCCYRPSFFASCWSAPAYMKDNNDRLHGGHLKKECYDLFAEYIVRFVKAYAEEGIEISGLTIQNEPHAVQTWESCNFEADEETAFAEVLKKHLKDAGLDMKLYCWDHNRERLFERADYCLSHTDVFAGTALHWYTGNHFEAVELLRKKYPDAEIFESEFCRFYGVERFPFFSYSHEYLGCLKSGADSIVEWNVILDENGGPFHDRGNPKYAGCEAPIRCDSKTWELLDSPIYKETWMFSYFIDNGAEVLYTSTYYDEIKAVAARNPNGDVVVNIVADDGAEFVWVRYHDELVRVSLPKGSVTTLVIAD